MTTPKEKSFIRMRELCYLILDANVPKQLNMSKKQGIVFQNSWRKILKKNMKYDRKGNYFEIESIAETFIKKFEDIVNFSKTKDLVINMNNVDGRRMRKGNCAYYNQSGFDPTACEDTGRKTRVKRMP